MTVKLTVWTTLDHQKLSSDALPQDTEKSKNLCGLTLSGSEDKPLLKDQNFNKLNRKAPSCTAAAFGWNERLGSFMSTVQKFATQFGLAILLQLTFASNVFAQYKEVPYSDIPMELGTGWHSATSIPADDVCIEFSSHIPPDQELDVKITQTKTTQSLYSKTSTGIDIALKSATGLGGTFKTTFEDESTSLFDDGRFFVRARVDNNAEVTIHTKDGPLRIKDKYIALLGTPDGLVKFRKTCGDKFLYLRRGGIELQGLSRESKLTREIKQNAEITWSANTGFAVALSGEINTEVNRKKVDDALNFSYYVLGGNSIAGSFDKAGIEKVIAELSSNAKPNNVRYKTMIVRDYRTLNWPDNNVAQPDGSSYEALVWEYVFLRDIVRYVDSALKSPSRYIDFTFSKMNLIEIDKASRQRMRDVSAAITSCRADKSKCVWKSDPTNIFSILSLLPLKRGGIEAEAKYEDDQNRRVALETELSSLREALTITVENTKYPPPTCEFILNPVPPVGGGGVSVPAPQNGGPSETFIRYGAACKDFKSIGDSLSAYSSIHRERVVRQGIFDVFVRDLNSELCKTDLTSPLCIDQSEVAQLESAANQRRIKECAGLEARYESLKGTLPFDPTGKKAHEEQMKLILDEAKALAAITGQMCVGQK